MGIALRLPVVAASIGIGLLVASAGCGGDGAERGADVAAGTEAAGAALDGEGMEPRIVVEHPIDAPGRPADGSDLAPVPPDPGTAWLPHLTVADPEASLDFYREHGFSVVSRRPEEGRPQRLELERNGARLVLVARAAGEGEEVAGDSAGEDEPAPAASAPPVLHLVEEGGGPAVTVTDPDGHRLALPGDR